MTYTRPSFDQADATWSGLNAYTHPGHNEAHATWFGVGTPGDPLGLGYKWSIQWREQGSTEVIGDISGLIQNGYVMTGLSAGTWYEWRVKGESGGQNVQWSEWQSFKTLTH